ncbi:MULTISPECIES: GNAT family protein [unclassified Beijerinckia]|uniref:GNAT family N-acetyltransferase n=1 Tax=unclassified Beijerinckia TaxID=2638183 RepID=UPI00089C2FAC|nr:MULTISPECIES: GNAT family protein [unclassified Beijerinckia]MDH7797979.1 RimJ/RimL family protein N-acetyltransferase [Beijerinckia sp. GAS462]SED04778.1 Protein N-acetyltransferase, RimJ/RimL family [Beijerinckia sp. 28-YEA-48]
MIDLRPTLSGPRVRLIPLETKHREALLAAAADGELWKLRVTTVPGPDSVDRYIEAALKGREAGTVIPFVTQVDARIVGSTRFWKIDQENRKLEIGHTWLTASQQRSFVNTEAKFLMLQHAFESLACVRVQFTTDELNQASRAAILRLGATEEGLIRNERIMPDGRQRNSMRYSIIDSEWPQVSARLRDRLGWA